MANAPARTPPNLTSGIFHTHTSEITCCFADFFLILINQILIIMSKGQDKKKETKKPATKTLKEKRAEKRAKKDGK
jgi:hypothetical protein